MMLNFNGSMPNMPMINNNNFYLNGNNIAEELIKPYQEKIKKLEKEIEEKDLQITQLKYKLFQYKKGNNNNQFSNHCMNQKINPMNDQMQMFNPMNQMNNLMNAQVNAQMQMFNPMNQMNNLMNAQINAQMQMFNPMNQMNDQIKQINENKNLSVIFRFSGESSHLGSILIQCQSNDKMKKVVNKFLSKANCREENYKFIYNEKSLVMNLTVEENGIEDRANIFVMKTNSVSGINNGNNNLNLVANQNGNGFQIKGTKIINLIFELNDRGTTYHFKAGNRNTIKEVFEQFLYEHALGDGSKKSIIFISNGNKINIKDVRTLDAIFNFEKGIEKILIFDMANVMGA